MEQREWTVENPIRGPWLSIYNIRLNFAHCLVNDFIYTHSRIVHMCGGELDIKYKKNVWGGIYSDGGTYLVPLVYGTPHLSIAKHLCLSAYCVCAQLFCSLSSGNVDSSISSMTGTCWDTRLLRYMSHTKTHMYMYAT